MSGAALLLSAPFLFFFAISFFSAPFLGVRQDRVVRVWYYLGCRRIFVVNSRQPSKGTGSAPVWLNPFGCSPALGLCVARATLPQNPWFWGRVA